MITSLSYSTSTAEPEERDVIKFALVFRAPTEAATIM